MKTELTVEKLEEILEFMPQPNHITVDAYGFDLSSITGGASDLLPEATLEDPGRITFNVEDPSREKVLAIYKHFYGKTDVLSTEFESPGIELNSVGWYLEHNGHIRLTPRKVEAKYIGEEPAYFTRMRHALRGTNINLEIKVENYTGDVPIPKTKK